MLYCFLIMIMFRMNTLYGVVLEKEDVDREVEEEYDDSELDHQQQVV